MKLVKIEGSTNSGTTTALMSIMITTLRLTPKDTKVLYINNDQSKIGFMRKCIELGITDEEFERIQFTVDGVDSVFGTVNHDYIFIDLQDLPAKQFWKDYAHVYYKKISMRESL